MPTARPECRTRRRRWGQLASPVWFGGVRLGKRSVAYHLMPIYGRPALLNGLSPALRRRMQGKACFNFSSVDEALLDELDELTARALEWYRAEGYLEAGARVRPNGTVDRPHS